MRRPQIPILYCDIDGTIRHGKDEFGRFVNRAEDVRVFDGVPELLAAYKEIGWRIIGISNQGGVALGYVDMRDCMLAMAETQNQCGGMFDKIFFCAHSPYDDCPCRKPKTLMVEASRDWLTQTCGEEYPLPLSLFVGDRPEDEMCAANAGLRFMNAEDWRARKHLVELYTAKGN